MSKDTTPNGTHIHIVTGSEGPKHDPYGFTEIWVEKAGRRVKLHTGLVTWLEVPGEGRRHFTDLEEEQVDYAFKQATDITPRQAERFWHRIRSTCKKCGCKESHSVAGYPGEILNVCDQCGAVVSTDFNRSAIE